MHDVLSDPIALAGRTAPNRLVFGPHETNLAHPAEHGGRGISARHIAYYARRAAGGAGVLVTEVASVHPTDWPYERAPLAERCGEGWAAVAEACRPHGTLVLAGLGHAGGQGSSAYSQRELWAPSRVPEVASREVPKWMEAEDIAAVVAGFGAAAKLAVEAGCDGVEVNAGQHSLIRQFLSGLTNHRGDEWADRGRFARDVLAAVRAAIGGERVLALRLSCDELAPWAGITPEAAEGIAAELAGSVDLLTVVRGAIFSVAATRPDGHEPAGFNIDLCRRIRSAVRAAGHATPVVLQGSVVDPGQAEWALGDGVCDLVEMTRAQIADADLGAKVAAGTPERVRPCVMCNQRCTVRDARNPIVSCIGDPSTGYETEDPIGESPADRPMRVVVVGAGPAGLECARVAALRGHTVTVVDRADRAGGALRTAALGAGRERLGALADWLEAECARLGVSFALGRTVADIAALEAEADTVLVATGSRPGRPPYDVGDGAAATGRLVDVADALAGFDTVFAGEGPVVVLDPIGGPIAISLVERLGARATLVTQDNIAGNELARTGDLAPANTRLAQQGVTLVRRAVVRSVDVADDGDGGEGLVVTVEDRFSGERHALAAAVCVDAGFRLPETALWEAAGSAHRRIGDAVAPRTVFEAVLEGRRAAWSLG
jgi:mycofactocin system FadH/OYE family oxidoreductase 1